MNMWLIPPSPADVVLKPQPWSVIWFIQLEGAVLNGVCVYYDEQVIFVTMSYQVV